MGDIQKEVEEGKRDWEKKCIMVTVAPLIAGLMISNRVESAIQGADPEVPVHNESDWISHKGLVTLGLQLYDELERQVTQRLTTGEPGGNIRTTEGSENGP